MKSALSSKNKETSVATQANNQLKIPEDSSKLEKQLKSLISKLESGANLLPNYRKGK